MKKRTFAIICMSLLSITLGYLTFTIVAHPLYSPFISYQSLTNSSNTTPEKLFLNSWKTIKKRYYDATLNNQNWERWKNRYKNTIQTEEDAHLAINTMLASLDDPYSRFLNSQEYAEQTTSIDSKIVGIGINITSISGKIVIISTVENTPAQKAGIKAGDILSKVDNKDVKGMNVAEIAQLIRGEKGTTVQIEYIRNGKKNIKTLTREQIEIKSVKHKILPENIGYIQITSFLGSNVAGDFLNSVNSVKDTKGLIIDLRGNTGGLLPNAVFIVDMFLKEGNIVSIVDRNGIKSDINVQDNAALSKKPMIILIDGATASASEIVSGALKDYKMAVLVGEKTYGKGMVQKIYPMPNKTGMNLTIAKYLTPNGSDINKKGIAPDYVVKYTEKDYYAQKDPQLDEAKKIMNKMCAL